MYMMPSSGGFVKYLVMTLAVPHCAGQDHGVHSLHPPSAGTKAEIHTSIINIPKTKEMFTF